MLSNILTLNMFLAFCFFFFFIGLEPYKMSLFSSGKYSTSKLNIASRKFHGLPLFTMADDDYLKAMEIQRRNFEAQFGSLESMGFEDKSAPKSSESEESEDETQFHGFDGESESDLSVSENERDSDSESEISSEESEHEVKVVKLTQENSTPVLSNKRDKKVARSGRAPTLLEMEEKERKLLKLTKKQQAKTAKEDEENLENDLKLQRLLSESHILANSLEYSGADLTMQTLDYDAPIGNARRRILDQRIREVSSTNATARKKLEKMPMNMRKTLIKNREQQVAKYEKEAREAGIILSKVKKGELRNIDIGKGVTPVTDRLGVGKGHKSRIRDRGLKIHSVGKSTRNGLRISQQEIDKVNNQGKKRRRK